MEECVSLAVLPAVGKLSTVTPAAARCMPGAASEGRTPPRRAGIGVQCLPMQADASPLSIDETEVETHAVRSQGAGGQNVNKVSSAIHLRFDIPASSLPDDVKQRLLALRDKRITQHGVLVIKAQSHRTQDQNRLDAFARLHELVQSVAVAPRVRRATRPTRASVQRRLQDKAQRAETKAARTKLLP